jgi:hypothetical protein
MGSPNHQDFASAALRHMRDAEHLLRPASYISRDQAWHLAGFAHECARKACVQDAWVPKMLGHDFSDASTTVLDLAISLDPRAGRFPVLGWARKFPAIDTWRPEHRYERTRTVDQVPGRDVNAIVSQGRCAVDDCIVALFLDGALEMESLR